MEKSNVLMFGWELPPDNTGGLGVACYGLTKSLAKSGVRISFALPRRLSSHLPFMKILSHRLQHVEFTAIDSLLEAYMTRISYHEVASSSTQLKAQLYGRTLYEEAQRYADMATEWSRKTPHNLIHAHDWMTYKAAMAAKKVSGKPFVAHIHATEYDRTAGQVDSRIAEIEYQGLNQADRVIAVSHFTKNVVHNNYGVPLSNIEVIHNGVDVEDFQPVFFKKLFPQDKVVLFVGRLTYQKGVGHFLNAAKKVLAHQPNTVFMVVGNGDMYRQLMVQAADLGIGHRVVFPGFVSGNKLRACYQMADVFVMPSVSEPYGIVALEAIATGIPTIISRQSGVSESIENVHKVDFWDEDKMSKLITTCLTFPKLSLTFASMAKKEVAKMTWDQAAAKTISVYNQLVV